MRNIISRLEGKSIPETAPVIGKIIIRDSTIKMKS
jgi:hypothetical protein